MINGRYWSAGWTWMRRSIFTTRPSLRSTFLTTSPQTTHIPLPTIQRIAIPGNRHNLNSNVSSSIGVAYLTLVYFVSTSGYTCIATGRLMCTFTSLCAKYCDQRVRMSVCKCGTAAYLKTRCPNFTKFSTYVACGRGSVYVDDVAVCYVLPVLWMPSCLQLA